MKFSRDLKLLSGLSVKDTLMFTYANKPFPFHKVNPPQVFVNKKEISIKEVLKSFDAFFPKKYKKICVYMPETNPWLHPFFLKALKDSGFQEILIIY